MRFAFLFVLGIGLAIGSTENQLFGQGFQVQSRNYKGVVKEVGRDFVVVKTIDAEIVARVTLDGALTTGNATSLSVQGLDGVEFLRRGMMVEFECRVTKMFKVHEPVNQFSVFTPLEFTRMEVQILDEPEGPAADAAKANEKPPAEDAKIDEKNDEKKTKKAKGKSKRTAKTRPARVIGRIASVSKRKITVEISRRGMQTRYIDVPYEKEKTLVEYDVADPALVSVGDSITVTGTEIRLPNVAATSIVVIRPTPPAIQKIEKEFAAGLMKGTKDEPVGDPVGEKGDGVAKKKGVANSAPLAAWLEWRPKVSKAKK